MGRLDHQVKIRGFRIELGEIENVLASHPAVTSSVVVVRRDAGGDQLVAYVAPREVNVPALRTHLASKLPEYMVPTIVMPLDSLPLTPSGKIDRKSLPEVSEGAYARQAYARPTSPVEIRRVELDVSPSELVVVGDVLLANGREDDAPTDDAPTDDGTAWWRLLRSTDLGATWTSVTLPGAPPDVAYVLIGPEDVGGGVAVVRGMVGVDGGSTRVPTAGDDGVEFVAFGAPIDAKYEPPSWG